MANIGGKIRAKIQTNTTTKNAIGESVKTWEDAYNIVGWLGLQSGGSDYAPHKAKLEESTHVFLCDFLPSVYALADRDTRMIIKGFVYDVLLIDNPDEMDEQLEIYLKRVGAWNG
jgi:head-tail adaptor